MTREIERIWRNGQMILQLPEDDAVIEKMFGFLRRAEVSFEEVI